MTTIRTVEIDAPSDPLAHRPELVWMSPKTSVFGWGEALRLAAGFGPDRFVRAERGFVEWVAAAEIASDDPAGPVAFSSFTFDERSAG
ncbi:MAG: isochorismate synthase, partial [Acidimicrobiia bacterium]